MSEKSIPTVPGVALNAPPAELMPSITDAINKALTALPTGANGAIVGVANEAGGNLAIVGRTPDDRLAVVGWVGKSWKGSSNYGAAVRVSW